MILPLVEAETKNDFAAVFERKMVRLRALYKALNNILDAEYTAGMTYDPKSLKKLILRKQNCVSRFEQLVRSMGGLLGMTAVRQMPSTVPITLVNRLKRISGLTRGQEDVLFALARDLDQRHLDLMEKSRRNSVFFKTALDRMSVASKYVNQGKMITP
jgi:hypothetical protein